MKKMVILLLLIITSSCGKTPFEGYCVKKRFEPSHETVTGNDAGTNYLLYRVPFDGRTTKLVPDRYYLHFSDGERIKVIQVNSLTFDSVEEGKFYRIGAMNIKNSNKTKRQ